jgi:hypothetical protein
VTAVADTDRIDEPKPTDVQIGDGTARDGSYAGPRERPVVPDDAHGHPPAIDD